MTLDEFLAQQQKMDLLRFITCGSVDDGKSTLIGRLLWESKQLFDDQLAALQAESKRYGTQGGEIDFALLVDGLAAEREQGITIDVAYRYFATQRRKFIVADTPGHEQYTRNMVTGASTADVALLLVDARHGLVRQTRRHTYLVSLVGIRHVMVVINKMDLVGYHQETYDDIAAQFNAFAAPLGFASITTIPLSALKGDNIMTRSAATPWYYGPTLMGYLDTVEVERPRGEQFVFPVQWVCRPDSTFRGFAGTLAEGVVRPGDEIRVTSSGQKAYVAEIVTMDGTRQVAEQGDAVTLRFDREIDASRGDVLSLAHAPLDVTDQFEAMIVWFHEDAGMTGRLYDVKLASQWTSGSITGIKRRVDVTAPALAPAKTLRVNDIAVCNVALTRPLAYTSFADSRTLGSFILADRFTHATVAVGMINHSLRRAQNVHKQVLSIGREDRERLNGHLGRVIWFTGLSGAGKSTLADALESALHRRGVRTYILDGDNVRQGLNRDLGFTDADRVENIRRVAEVAKLMADAGLVVMTAFISPFRREREMARELIGASRFVEVYVSTPLAVCEERDVKGLYKKSRAGKIPNMTGLNSPYEAPEAPAFSLDASNANVDSLVDELLNSGLVV